MIYSDAPIGRKEEDRLNRSGFSSQLAEIILGMDAEDGLCVSINGAWGSGKTSVINLIENELKEMGGEKAPIILHFSPWNFVTTEQLFQQFFSLLADKFSEKGIEGDKAIAKAILEYANAIDSLHPGIKVVSLLALLLNKSVAKRDKLHASGLQKQRTAIIDMLKKRDGRIVVIIDDIDRLTDEEIRLVFQLVNAVAKFPNIIYLVSFDKSVVVNALKSQQNSDGEKYLEKIVQVPISLPELKPNQVEEVLFSDLDDLIKRYNYSFETDHWHNIYHYCLSGSMTTIRDVKRFMSSLEVKCSLVRTEVDVIDLLAITYIEQKEPKFYEWIKNNRATLTHKGFGVIYDFDKKINQMKDEIKTLDGDLDHYIKELDTLFPLWNIQYPMNSDELRRYRRVGYKSFVDRYFCFEIEPSDIPSKDITDFIYNDSLNDMELYIDELIDQTPDSIGFLLSEIDASLSLLDEDRKELLAKLLIKYSAKLKGDNQRSIFEVSVRRRAEYMIEKILGQIGNTNTVFSIIKVAINEADIDSIQALAVLINTIELAHGRLAAQGEKRTEIDELVDEDQLNTIESEFINAVRRLKNTTDILDIEDDLGVQMVLYLYESLTGEDEFANYVEDIKKSSVELLKYIRTYAIRVTSTNGIFWKYSEKYTKYISLEEVQAAYKECLGDGSILLLTDDLLTRVVAFEIWNANVNYREDGVPESIIEKRKSEIMAGRAD